MPSVPPAVMTVAIPSAPDMIILCSAYVKSMPADGSLGDLALADVSG